MFVGQACNLYSMSLVPLYDTLGPDACVFIVNQGKKAIIFKVVLIELKTCKTKSYAKKSYEYFQTLTRKVCLTAVN